MDIMKHEASQSTTFFSILQNNNEIDLRDNRGKRHALNVVLVGCIISICRNRDGNLSSIHRGMVNTHESLMKSLQSTYKIDYQVVISRSHLPILLKKVCLSTFSQLIFEYFGVSLNAEEKTWFSMDGKELRGTILPNSTRGEAIVQAVRHSDRQVFCQGYYNGSKDSEQPVVQDLLKKNGLGSQGISLDALHFNPKTLSYINNEGGSYVVGLKGNQEEISIDMNKFINTQNADFEYIRKEKGHGRAESRSYYSKDLNGEYFDKRWKYAGFKTVIMVKRTRVINSSQKYSEETSYYMSNEKASTQVSAEHLFSHIREHWSVEVNNHVRDVTFSEDALQTKFRDVARPISLIRTLIINILQKNKVKNYVQLIETFVDNFNLILQFLKSVKVL